MNDTRHEAPQLADPFPGSPEKRRQPRDAGRRRLLAGALASVVLAGVGYLGGHYALRRWRARRLHELKALQLQLVTLSGEASVFIGHAYLQESGTDADANMLVNTLADRIGSRGEMADLRRRYMRRVRKDFRHGDTVRVAAWELSSTETLLAALAAATSGARE